MGFSENTTIKKNIGNAMKIIEKNFPNFNHSKLDEFNVNINEAGEITIKTGTRSNAVSHNLFDENGDLNENIPQAVQNILGEQINSKGLREKIGVEKDKKKFFLKR